MAEPRSTPDRDRPARIRPAEVRPAVGWLLAVASIVTLAAVPAVQHLGFEGWRPVLRPGPFAPFADGVGGAFGRLEPGERLRPGAWLGVNHRLLAAMDELESRLEDESAVLERFLPTVQWLLAAYGGVGNETVYLGYDGWLVFRPGFDYLTGPPFLDPDVLDARRSGAPSWEEPPHPDPRPALADFHRQLGERGVRLLLLTVPTKPMIHPEALAPGTESDDATLQNPSFPELQLWLEEQGIELLDAAPILRALRRESGTDAFLRTDSHWSPAAVEATARAVEARIRELGIRFTERGRFYRSQEVRHQALGDLGQLLRLPDWQRLYPPEEVTGTQVLAPDGRLWSPENGAEVLLLGDSFTNVYSVPALHWGRGAGLAEQLARLLRRPVDRIAIADGSATAVRERLAQRLAADPQYLADVKIVVYQVAVREFTVGDWRPVALP